MTTIEADQAIDAAVRIADAEGLDAVTVARVAAALGVRPHHLASLEALRRAVTLRGLRELGDVLRRAASGRVRAGALVAVADAYRVYAHAHPGCFAAAIVRPATGDVEVEQAGGEIVGVIVAVVGGWGIEDDDARHAARAIRGALHGFVTLEAAGGFGAPADCDESFVRLVRTLASGLEAAAPATA